mgnify:CR=1 FL=1
MLLNGTLVYFNVVIYNYNEEILFIFYFGFITYLDFVTRGTIYIHSVHL